MQVKTGSRLIWTVWLNFKAEFAAFDGAKAPMPRWQQEWFPRLDGAMAYAMVRRIKPKTIIEVGSGHSTRFMARAVADGQLDTRIIAIDPAPRADITQLDRMDLHQMPVQQADWALFDQLQAGDILFVDSSHILMPGTDVDILFNHILPKLPAGVWVHIHDITLPDDYPISWEWRGYNEQQAVVPMVTSGGFQLEWSSHYAASRMRDAVAASLAGGLPISSNALETSLWLVKN